MIHAIIAAGGTAEQRPESTHKVSFWYIPGGANYDLATVKEAFFPNAACAEAFATKYHNPPEMAVVIPL